MPAAYLHGVETIEIDSGARQIRQVRTAVIGLVGTAPIFQLNEENKTINIPKQILSEKDAAMYFGTKKSGYSIPQALDGIFDQGAGSVIVVNVFDPSVHKTVVDTPEEKAFVSDKIDLGHEGIMNLVVKSQDGVTTYVLGTDYNVDLISGIITRLSTGSIAADATVQLTYDYADVSKVSASDIIGEVDTSGNRTGIKAFEDSRSKYGYGPKLLIAPGYSTLVSVATELEAIAHKLRAVAFIDAPAGSKVDDAISGRGPEGEINFNFSSSRLALCFPHLKVYDSVSDSEILEPMSSRLAGVQAALDIEKGYWWSPSNKNIKGITGVERPITFRVNDPNCEANQLNAVGIITIANDFGTGIRTWGNRSSAYPSDTSIKNFISVLRTADVIADSIEYNSLQFMDRPITNGLIDSIVESVNAFLRTLKSRGAIIEGSCSYDPSKNDATEIAAGHLVFDYTFVPPPPAERLTFNSFIDISLLSSLGGK